MRTPVRDHRSPRLGSGSRDHPHCQPGAGFPILVELPASISAWRPLGYGRAARATANRALGPPAPPAFDAVKAPLIDLVFAYHPLRWQGELAGPRLECLRRILARCDPEILWVRGRGGGRGRGRGRKGGRGREEGREGGRERGRAARAAGRAAAGRALHTHTPPPPPHTHMSCEAAVPAFAAGRGKARRAGAARRVSGRCCTPRVQRSRLPFIRVACRGSGKGPCLADLKGGRP